MKFMARFLYFGAIASLMLALTPLSFAHSKRKNCFSYDSNLLQKKVNYCVNRTTPNEPYLTQEPVTYFMHGTNGNAKTWYKDDYARALANLQKGNAPLPHMTFISFDTSRYSFFLDQPGNPRAAYETWFLEEFIPYIESRYSVCNHKECRGLMGESMGGFGALKTILRHPNLFSAVAVNSPALPPFDIHAPKSQWVKFFSHEAIGPVIGFFLIELVRKLMPSETSWESQDPIELSENLAVDEYPPLYFDMGGRDKYGFNYGYFRLRKVLDARDIPYTTFFEPKAGHDMWKRHAVDSMKFLFAHVGEDTEYYQSKLYGRFNRLGSDFPDDRHR